jgi:hypothetical protein
VIISTTATERCFFWESLLRLSSHHVCILLSEPVGCRMLKFAQLETRSHTSLEKLQSKHR